MDTKDYLQIRVTEDQRAKLETLAKRLSTKISTLGRIIILNNVGFILEPHLYKAFKQLTKRKKQ